MSCLLVPDECMHGSEYVFTVSNKVDQLYNQHDKPLCVFHLRSFGCVDDSVCCGLFPNKCSKSNSQSENIITLIKFYLFFGL